MRGLFDTLLPLSPSPGIVAQCRDGSSANSDGSEVRTSQAATFAIEWMDSYRINGLAFVYSDRDTGRVITILGYPTDKLVDIE
jgi:hypothetical protein